MLSAIATRPALTAYRCPKGCWWETDGCYCPDGFQFRSLRGAADGVGTIVGLGLVGLVIWGVVGASKAASRVRGRR